MAEMPGWMVTGMGIAGRFWLLVGIAVLILIVVAVVWLVTRLRGDRSSGGRVPTTLDRDTYLQMRQDILGR